MAISTESNLTSMSGLYWYPNGQNALSGAPWRLAQQLDQLFLRWAAEVQAQDYSVPTFIPAAELARLDYFHSFPHLVTFPVALDPAEENVRQFVEQGPLREDGAVQLTACTPTRDVLTPAACYHFYILHQGQTLAGPRYLTTRTTCFRREQSYAPLRRQWSFSMREIVCMGTADEVQGFLQSYQARLDRFFTASGLAITWENATDPFFQPASNPKSLAQKLDPVKTEMIFPVTASAANPSGQLAIGSVNFHRNYFGEAFGITRNGHDAFTGCIAFGLERWLFAFLTQFGHDAAHWSNLKLWEG
jgi:seryl-tRNA synthetase